MKKKLKVVLMSGTATGCRYIENLKKHDAVSIDLVVTGIDRPRGRGKNIEKALVAGYCDIKELKVYQTENINSGESLETLKQAGADLAIVVDFGQILSRDVLNMFPLGSFNIHYSILPDLRGPDPVRWALLKGYAETGVTLIKINEKIDAGEIIAIQKINIEESDNYETLKKKMTDEGVKALSRILNDIYNGNCIETKPQEEIPGMTYARKLSRELCAIDWNIPAKELICRIKAFSPAPGCTAVYKKKNMKLKIVTAVESHLCGDVPGRIIDVSKDDFTVAADKGSIKVIDLQPSGKRIMSVKEFLAGNPVEIGDIFE